MIDSESAHSPQFVTSPAVMASEVRRFKRVLWVVLILGLSVLAVIFIYGDSPRPFVNRLNLVLGPVVLLTLGLLTHAIWRFRQRCGDWPGHISGPQQLKR